MNAWMTLAFGIVLAVPSSGCLTALSLASPGQARCYECEAVVAISRLAGPSPRVASRSRAAGSSLSRSHAVQEFGSAPLTEGSIVASDAIDAQGTYEGVARIGGVGAADERADVVRIRDDWTGPVTFHPAALCRLEGFKSGRSIGLDPMGARCRMRFGERDGSFAATSLAARIRGRRLLVRVEGVFQSDDASSVEMRVAYEFSGTRRSRRWRAPRHAS